MAAERDFLSGVGKRARLLINNNLMASAKKPVWGKAAATRANHPGHPQVAKVIRQKPKAEQR